MCCEIFWKKVVVFSLAFGISVFVSNAFTSSEIPTESIKTTINLAPQSKNCVPVDGNLKYERLTTAEEQAKLATKKQEEKKKVLKNSQEKQNNFTQSQQFYVPSKDSAEYKILLHREQCFEAQGQK